MLSVVLLLNRFRCRFSECGLSFTLRVMCLSMVGQSGAYETVAILSLATACRSSLGPLILNGMIAVLVVLRAARLAKLFTYTRQPR